ncbi:MAG: restriction endonuclease [Bacteroidetes bacterium]|nr:restriction endonuclease [Bacteroidota bacterium]MBL7104865.1 restriction endonuclease [Bacteroidales bacterium]
MQDLITIEQAVSNFKQLIEDSIIEGGTDGKQAMIRSSKPINNIHEAVKSKLINNGIARHRIFPPLGETKPELKLAGFFKQKYQDVCVTPEGKETNEDILMEGLLQEATDYYGHEYTERIISINIRSQISSLAKNFDTLYERTIAEAQNLHVRCPRMCLGEVYMIAVPEYSSNAFKNNEVVFLDRAGTVEKYIKSFQAVNGRTDTGKDEYKYERICLLIVDFSQSMPKIYNTDEELKEAGLLSKNTDASIAQLTWETFMLALLEEYQARFGT